MNVRLHAARSLAWTLLLAGWIGIGSIAQSSTSGPMPAFGWIAAWLLMLGAAAEVVGRWRLIGRVQRIATAVAGALTVAGLYASSHGGGVIASLPIIVGWATFVALASGVVRACRVSGAAARRSASPAGPAAIGALVAWLCVGDIGDVQALVPRLIAWVCVACASLLWLTPETNASASRRRAGACRAGLFDCSLPAWSIDDWRSPRRWPISLASFAMLPMMCSIPWMVNLCRGDAAGPQAVLGLHLAAMFLPALLVARHRLLLALAPAVCATLLIAGALSLVLNAGAAGWWIVAATHGAAWSIAWAARLSGRGERRSAQAPLVGASFNALFGIAIGIAVATTGLSALADGHIALGAAAGIALLWAGGASMARSPRGDTPW